MFNLKLNKTVPKAFGCTHIQAPKINCKITINRDSPDPPWNRDGKFDEFDWYDISIFYFSKRCDLFLFLFYGEHIMVFTLGKEVVSTYVYCCTHSRQKEMGVSKNNGTPKSSTLIGISITYHPFWGTPIFGHTQISGISICWGQATRT